MLYDGFYTLLVWFVDTINRKCIKKLLVMALTVIKRVDYVSKYKALSVDVETMVVYLILVLIKGKLGSWTLCDVMIVISDDLNMFLS